MARREVLTDEQGVIIAPLIPETQRPSFQRGRPWKDTSEALNECGTFILNSTLKMPPAPQTISYNRDGILLGWQLLQIPSSGSHLSDLPIDQTVSHQPDQREQTENDRRCPSDDQAALLSLSFYPEMRSGFFKGNLHSSTAHESSHNLQWCMIAVSQKKCPWFIFALLVADQHS
jgi:hypothetical protein